MPSSKILPRNSSFAEVLNELGKVKLEFELEEKSSPQHQPQQQQSKHLAPMCGEHRGQARKAVTAPPSSPAHKLPAHDAPTSLPMIDAALIGIFLAVGAALIFGVTDASAVALPLCLVSLGLALLGVGTVKEMLAAWVTSGALVPSCTRVPLTDATISLETVNKFANSCQVREKGLKILQYALRLGAYSGLLAPPAAALLKTLSKTTSIARRFFKFCRWVKHFDDLAASRVEKDSKMRTLLLLRGCANLAADWSEDICSLERIGLLPAGTLSVGFQLFAEYCQLKLALLEVSISAVLVGKQQLLARLMVDKLALSENSPSKQTATGSVDSNSLRKAERQLAMLRLELVKFVSDIGKAVFDCQLAFADEGVFIFCALFSALISTHKNMVKVLNSK